MPINVFMKAHLIFKTNNVPFYLVKIQLFFDFTKLFFNNMYC